MMSLIKMQKKRRRKVYLRARGGGLEQRGKTLLVEHQKCRLEDKSIMAMVPRIVKKKTDRPLEDYVRGCIG